MFRFAPAVSAFRRRFAKSLVVLTYHRVARLDRDPQLLCVQPDNFMAHMEIIKRLAYPVQLEDMDGYFKTFNRRKGIAVTFDDGYADNLHHAAPIVERSKVPITIFISTGFVDRSREFWWDYLERVFLGPSELPEKVELVVGHETVNVDFRGYGHWSINDAAKYNRWNVLESVDPTPRHRVYRKLCELVKPLTPEVRRDTINRIEKWSGIENIARDTHKILSREDLKCLCQHAWINLGAHTINHVMLATSSDLEKESEIGGPQEFFEKLSLTPVDGFAYPYGMNLDFDDTSVRYVKQKRYKYACANYPGKLNYQTDRYKIPRFMVRDWSAGVFESHLRRWLR